MEIPNRRLKKYNGYRLPIVKSAFGYYDSNPYKKKLVRKWFETNEGKIFYIKKERNKKIFKLIKEI